MKLKEMRLKFGLTQEEMAKELHLKRATYANYENSITEPTLDILITMADFLHISVDELIGRKQNNFIDKGLLTDEQINIINIMKDLNKSNIDKLYGCAVALQQVQTDEQNIINKFNHKG